MLLKVRKERIESHSLFGPFDQTVQEDPFLVSPNFFPSRRRGAAGVRKMRGMDRQGGTGGNRRRLHPNVKSGLEVPGILRL